MVHKKYEERELETKEKNLHAMEREMNAKLLKIQEETKAVIQDRKHN